MATHFSSLIPLGFTYWEQGNWESTGTITSGDDDYITTVLPKSGKYYWETELTALASAQVLGIGVGNWGAGTGYENDLIGYYYNGPVPLFLTRTGAGDHGDAVSHGTTTGTTWEVGKKLMWAYDPGDAPNTGKVWLGYDGTWYGSGDPATGTNPSISGADLSPANSGTNYHLKLGYTDGGGPINLSNVRGSSSSTSFTGTAEYLYEINNQGIIGGDVLQDTTATPLVTPTWGSTTRVERTQNFTFAKLGGSVRGFLQGRRPAHGLKYPRGYYNK